MDYNLIDAEETNVTPTFYGYRIEKDDMDLRTLYLRYMSSDASSGKGSVYIIKPLDAKRLPYWIIAIVMIPIIFGTIYIAVRNRRFTED